MDITKSNQGADPAGAEVLAEFRSTRTRRERCDAKMARLIEQPYDSTRKPERDARLRLCLTLIKEPLERDDYDRVESEINAAYRDLAPMVNACPRPIRWSASGRRRFGQDGTVRKSTCSKASFAREERSAASHGKASRLTAR